MSTLTGIIPLAISWEEISPLIFLALYFLAQWFVNSRKKQAEQELQEGVPSDTEESAATERARRLQEEIRRRIAEKMREVQEAAQEAAKEEDVRPMERKTENTRPMNTQQEAPRPVQPAPAMPEPIPQPVLVQPALASPVPTATFSAASQDSSSVSQDLLARLEAIRAAQGAQMDDSQRSAAAAASAYAITKEKVTDAGDRRAILQSELRDKDSIKRAFIMAEILGKPVSLR